MSTQQSLAAAVLEPSLEVSVDRLYRISSDVYQGMIGHGLIATDQIALIDGLLTAGTDGLYRMPLDIYHRIAEIGLLGPGDKVELLDGLLVKKMTKGAPHVRATNRVFRQLSAVVPKGWEVRKEDPITLPTTTGRDSEPEPDVFVVRGDLDDYTDHHPGPADLVLVVEVAWSSLREDRAVLTLYAWSKIPIAWVVNLTNETVEVYCRPTGPAEPSRYDEARVYQKDDRVPVLIDGREVGQVAVRDLLP